MQGSAAELASVVSRALLVASSRTWTPALEQTLHRLGCRDSLSPDLVARVIDPLLLNHHSLAFGFFNWASQQPGFSHTSSTYQSLLKSLTISRQFNSIHKLLKQVRKQKVFLQPHVYRSVIDSLVAGRRMGTAFSLFQDVSSISREIGPEVCNSLLAALASDGSMESARNVFDEMLNRTVQFSTLGFGVFVWWACRKMELSEILGLIDHVKKVDFAGVNGSVIALLLIHGLCAESRVKDAMLALEELRKRECKPDFMAYRVVAQKLREMGFVVDVEMTLKRKRKLGVAPRMNDYKELILQFVKERFLCEAKELGEVIVSGDFPIEDDVLNVLIGSVSYSDPPYAISFLRFMLEKQRSPTLLTLINLSGNLCKHKKGEELVEVFQLLSTMEYFKDLVSYNLMVSCLCKTGKVKEAYQVIQEMKKKGVGPDVSSYNSLLEACCREDLMRPAKRLWDEMFACGCCGNLESYIILIRKNSELDQVEDACRLFYQMLGKGLEPDESIYKSLLQGLCRAKNLELALEIFNKAVEQGEELATALLRTFVLCLCKEGFLLPVSRLLRDFTGGVGCVESHLTFLRYSTDAGEHSLACKHLQWIADESPELLHAIQPEFGKFRHLPIVENGEVIAQLDITKCLFDAISRMEKAPEQASSIAAAVEGVEHQFRSNISETLRERVFKPSLSTFISETSKSCSNCCKKNNCELRVHSVLVMIGNSIHGILKYALSSCGSKSLSRADSYGKDGSIAALLDVLQITHAAISMYEDDEGDKFLRTADGDLANAVACARSAGIKVLRLHLEYVGSEETRYEEGDR